MGEAARYGGGTGRGLGTARAEAPVRGSDPVRGSGPRRRSGRGVLAAVSASALLVAGAGTLAPAAYAAPAAARAGAAHRAPRPAAPTPLDSASRPSQTYPVAVLIGTVTPSAPGRHDVLQVSGTARNTGERAITQVRAVLRLGGGRPTGSRSQIAAVAGRTAPVPADGPALPRPSAALGTIPAGGSVPFHLSVKTADLHLPSDGVYELAADVRQEQPGRLPRTLGIARTFLPWFPDTADVHRTRIATLWPVTRPPELEARTLSDEQQTPVLSDDLLAADLRRGGRLDGLVAAGAHLPVTWVVDPDVLDTATAMTGPYQVRKPETSGRSDGGDDTVAGTGIAAAHAWLDALRGAVQGRETVPLPYADPDLASVAHHGTGVAGLGAALSRAFTAGRVTAAGRLATDMPAPVAWPYAGYADPRTVAVARSAGARTILLDSRSVGEPAGLNHTPSAVRPLGHGVTAVVADDTVSGIFRGGLATPAEQTLAVQRYLAETLMITLEQPSNQRSVLVAPPRDMSAGAARALATALTAAQHGRWVQAVPLSAVEKAAADPEAGRALRGYPASLRRHELAAADLRLAMGLQGRLARLMAVLSDPERVRRPFSAAIGRSLSTEWRTAPGAGDSYRTGLNEYLNRLVGAVHLADKGEALTLPGESGTIPVSIINDLTQPVRNLELRVTSAQPNRLNIGPPVPVAIDGGGHRKTLRFPALAKANGPVEVTAQLFTTDSGRPYGQPMVFKVRVTSVTGGVIWVIAGGVLLVLLAGVRMYGQRKKRAQQALDAAEESGPAAPGMAGEAGTAGEDSPLPTAAGGTPPAAGRPARDEPVRDEKVEP